MYDFFSDDTKFLNKVFPEIFNVTCDHTILHGRGSGDQHSQFGRTGRLFDGKSTDHIL